MLPISAAQQAVLNAGVQAEFMRASIKDTGGTWRDLTVYPGFNAVKSIQLTEQIDSPQKKFTLLLFRELYGLSLSPFLASSPLNLGFNPTASPAALIATARDIKFECAIVPADTQPAAGDWFTFFTGRVEKVDAASGYNVQVEGTGAFASRLSRQFIKYERVYSYAVDGGVAVALRVWEANQVYAAGEYILPASRSDGTGSSPATPDPGYNKFVKVMTGGTSGTTEPVWTTGAGQTDGSCVHNYIGAPTTSGNPVEQVIQNMLDNNRGSGDGAVTLYTPASPLWNITQFLQQREFTLDAIVALAQQIGWDLRDRWRTGTSQFELTLYEPERSSPTVLFTFGPSDYGQPTGFAIDLTQIRTHIIVWYGDASDLWPDGTPKRKQIEVSDSGAIAKYEDLIMEVQEDQTAQIDSSTEGNELANNSLSDLKEPTAEMAVPLMRGFPWVELNDYYTFSANGLHFDSDQSLAVTQYQHTFENGTLKTTLQLRGKPTIGAQSYLKKRVQPKSIMGKQYPHQQTHFSGPSTPSVQLSNVVGGQRIQLAQSFDKRQIAEEYELHVYPTAGTALSGSTLKAIAKDRVMEVADLNPGKKQYVRVVPRFHNSEKLIRMQPTVERNFIAGRAVAGHLSDGTAYGSYPINGGFEGRFDPNDFPDWWTPTVGALGVDFFVMEDGNGVSGGRYMKVVSNGSTQPNLQSALLPIINESGSGTRLSGIYRFRAWVKTDAGNVSGGDNMWLAAKGVDYTGGSPAGAGLLSVASDSKPGLWQLITGSFTWGFTSAKSAFVNFFTDHVGSTHGQIFYIDEIRFDYIGSPLYVVGIGGGALTDAAEAIPTFDNGWADGSNMDAGDDCFYASPGFRRTVDGYGEIVGHAMSATAGSGLVGDVPIWTLPPSFCPLETFTYPVSTDQGPGWLQVQACGDVCLRAGGNGWVDFGCIRFPLFAFN